MSIKEMMMELKKYKYLITKQQYHTIKGQILKGDIDAARKGIFTCLYKNRFN